MIEAGTYDLQEERVGLGGAPASTLINNPSFYTPINVRRHMNATNTTRLTRRLRTFVLVLFVASAMVPVDASGQTSAAVGNIRGDWQARMVVSGTARHWVFSIGEGAEAALVGTVFLAEAASPPAPITVSVGLDTVSLSGPRGLRFVGRRGATWDSVPGTIYISGKEFPTVLTRVVRTQRVADSVPYHSRELSFPSADSVRLAATFTLPSGKGAFPAVLMLSGSGPQDRNATVLAHQPFALLADYLARRGIASLRYDERGVGKSSGQYATAGLSDLRTDAEAAFAVLRAQAEVDSMSVGLLGHSEGGLIAPTIASHLKSVSFLVLLSAPAIRGDSTILLQTRALAAGMGVVSFVGSRTDSLNWKFYEGIRSAKDSTSEEQVVSDYVSSLLTDVPEVQLPAARAQIVPQARAALMPEVVGLLRSDPQASLQRLRSPILALYGELDMQVPARFHERALRDALTTAGNTLSDVRILPKLNHMLQPATTGMVSEYFVSPVTMDPSVFEIISRWILEMADNGARRPARLRQ